MQRNWRIDRVLFLWLGFVSGFVSAMILWNPRVQAPGTHPSTIHMRAPVKLLPVIGGCVPPWQFAYPKYKPRIGDVVTIPSCEARETHP